jgi:hypothetical protein
VTADVLIVLQYPTGCPPAEGVLPALHRANQRVVSMFISWQSQSLSWQGRLFTAKITYIGYCTHDTALGKKNTG